MCSASMGAEGSVTLQLREAVQAPDPCSPLDGSLTIGYPDPEMLADMLGSIQAAGTYFSLLYRSSIVLKKTTILNPMFKKPVKMAYCILCVHLYRNW